MSPIPSVTTATMRPIRASQSCGEPVADAPNRLEVVRLGRIVLDLLAQAAHVHRDRSRVERRRVPPYAHHQLVAREHPAWMAREEPEEIELLRRQAQFDPALRTSRVARSSSTSPNPGGPPTMSVDRTAAKRSLPARRVRAGRTASSRSHPHRARARRCGRPPRRGR